MTSCQRPKECEPSRYRHGSDPPKQVPTASPTLVEHFLRLQRNPHSIHSLTSRAKKLNREPERCPGPIKREVSSMSLSTITVVVPCAENESVFLLHVVNAAIQAYRRSHVRRPEVPVDRVKFDKDGENVSRAA